MSIVKTQTQINIICSNISPKDKPRTPFIGVRISWETVARNYKVINIFSDDKSREEHTGDNN